MCKVFVSRSLCTNVSSKSSTNMGNVFVLVSFSICGVFSVALLGDRDFWPMMLLILLIILVSPTLSDNTFRFCLDVDLDDLMLGCLTSSSSTYSLRCELSISGSILNIFKIFDEPSGFKIFTIGLLEKSDLELREFELSVVKLLFCCLLLPTCEFWELVRDCCEMDGMLLLDICWLLLAACDFGVFDLDGYEVRIML